MEQPKIIGKNTPPNGITPSIILTNPKYCRNVSAIIRLCSGYGIQQLWYTGDRVSLTDPEKNLDLKRGTSRKGKGKARLPREERMKGYKKVQVYQYDKPFDRFPAGTRPVAVELKPGATMLHHYIHHPNNVYVFGPEDGSVPSTYLSHCHEILVIPVEHCLNLATAVATVLWDRKQKALLSGEEPDLLMNDILSNDRAALRYAIEDDEEFSIADSIG